MEKFEYRIFNKSEVGADKKITWLDVLNRHGQQGWKVITSITNNSYLMVRKIQEIKPDNDVETKVDRNLNMKSIY